MRILSNRNAYHLAIKLGLPIARVKRKRFPDGEIYLRLLEDADAIISSMFPNQNDALMETLQMVNALKRTYNKEPIAILAYMAYGRQDRQFLTGEAVSAEIVLRSIKSLGASEIYVVEPHSIHALSNIARPIYVHETIGERISNNIEDPLLISPDFGRSELIERISKAFGFDYAALKKYRDRETGEIVTEGEIDANGRNVVIVDDIISTGGTMENAIRIARQSGAKSVTSIIIHGLFIESAYWRVNADKIVTTDTILTPYSEISVAKDIKSVLE